MSPESGESIPPDPHNSIGEFAAAADNVLGDPHEELLDPDVLRQQNVGDEGTVKQTDPDESPGEEVHYHPPLHSADRPVRPYFQHRGPGGPTRPPGPTRPKNY